MAELIFHHYPNSPFSEKIRLIFGLKHLAWRSVLIPVILPKPDVVALTGGYRKTPVLQIGADIYCDSALIARVLGGCRALGRARAGASFGARLGAGEACGRATQRVGNDAWRRN